VNILSPNADDKFQMLCKLEKTWKCVKGIILGKAAGLHRIIGNISTSWEAELKRKHNLETGTRKELKRKTSPTKPPNITSQHISTPTKCVNCKPKDKINASPALVNTCTGISCNRMSTKWQLFKHFTPNKIRHNTKHCIRCSKYCTIMRLGVEVLTNMLNIQNSLTHQHKFVTFLSKSKITNPSYPPFMNMLNDFIPQRKIKEKAKYTKRSKMSDQHKNLCKIFIQAYIIVKGQSTQDTDEITAIVNLLTEDLDKINKSLADTKHKSKLRDIAVTQILFDFEHEETKDKTSQYSIELETPQQHSFKPSESSTNQHVNSPSSKKTSQQDTALVNTKSPIIIDITDVDGKEGKETAHNNSSNDTDRDQRRHYINEALNDSGGFLSSMGVMRAIEVFRHEADTNHYFASSEAQSILNSWSPTEGWERAARIFGSRFVMANKPNGFYFIPVFDSGHWSLAIIQKIGRFKQGYMVDSLGTSSTNQPFNRKIEDMFRVHGGRFDWNNCSSIRQQEYECGLRMIIAILRIRKSPREGLTLEEGIHSATLRGEYNSETMYDSMKIRREAAIVIGRYEHTMWTGPVRIRNIRNEATTNDAGGNQKVKRRRRRK